MKVQEGSFIFDFSDAIQAFKFDEKDKEKYNYHGLSHCMKAVDIVAEYSERYLFVEVKDPKGKLDRYDSDSDRSKLINDLTYKFRDTFLYRFAEHKIDKPINYLCLIELDNVRIFHLSKILTNQLPLDNLPQRWIRPIVASCAVLNSTSWNRNFPRIPVTISHGGQC